MIKNFFKKSVDTEKCKWYDGLVAVWGGKRNNLTHKQIGTQVSMELKDELWKLNSVTKQSDVRKMENL